MKLQNKGGPVVTSNPTRAQGPAPSAQAADKPPTPLDAPAAAPSNVPAPPAPSAAAPDLRERSMFEERPAIAQLPQRQLENLQAMADARRAGRLLDVGVLWCESKTGSTPDTVADRAAAAELSALWVIDGWAFQSISTDPELGGT